MFGIFKSPRHRAAPRSFNAFKVLWFDCPLSEYIERESAQWEERYQSTLKLCETQGPIGALNRIIDFEMAHFVGGAKVATTSAQQHTISESDAHGFFSSSVLLGILGNFVFAYVPAVASFGEFDADRVCYDTGQSILRSIENRKAEMHPDYAERGTVVMTAFLSTLFDSK